MENALNRFSVVLVNVLLLLSAWPALASCPPEGYSKSTLTELRESGFAIEARERNALAVNLLDCLADPDPTIRDGVVYEGLATWLRNGQLDASTISTVFQRLQADQQMEGVIDALREEERS